LLTLTTAMTTNDNKDCSLNLRRAQGHRPGDWNPEDFDVLDDGRNVGRI
jgi:hypothetical protein